ncbi:hypothetical protein SMD22_00405 (plasmid) [Brevibacillus halotolerans]|nr:hypothetical protein SMD22_00405 [Brevibacillus halotolerans]
MSITVEALKKRIAREIDLIPEDGVTDEYDNWTSKEDEEKRLRRLLDDITYFMREYS